MKGTRPLTASEVAIVADTFDGTYATRNRCLFMIGVSTGGRISELLNLTIGDVYQNGRPVTDLHYRKSIVKGKEHARSVPVNRDGTKAITEIIAWHTQQYGCLDDKRPLFPSRNRVKGIVPITRQQAHKIFKRVCQQAALNGNLATHSLRKSYAQRLYSQMNDIFSIKEMLGHQNITTTQAYLGVDYEKVRAASEAISIMNGDNNEKELE